MRGGAIGSEVLPGRPGVVDIGDEVRAHLVSILQQDVHTVVVTHKLGNAGSEGVDLLLALVHPVVSIKGKVL